MLSCTSWPFFICPIDWIKSLIDPSSRCHRIPPSVRRSIWRAWKYPGNRGRDRSSPRCGCPPSSAVRGPRSSLEYGRLISYPIMDWLLLVFSAPKTPNDVDALHWRDTVGLLKPTGYCSVTVPRYGRVTVARVRLLYPGTSGGYGRILRGYPAGYGRILPKVQLLPYQQRRESYHRSERGGEGDLSRRAKWKGMEKGREEGRRMKKMMECKLN